MTTTPKEKCLYYGLPGIAILAIATFITIKVADDFPNDLFVKCPTFIGSNALGWLLYYILQTQLQELSPFLPSFHPKNTIYNKECEEEDETIIEELSETEESIITEQGETQDVELSTEQPESVGEQNGHPLAESIPVQFLFSSEQYRQRNEEMERERAEQRKSKLLAIAEYIQYTMSPYLREEDLLRLNDEIMAWAVDSAYQPKEIPLKNNLLTTFDLRHFVWNIGERLGNGYTGEIRADFIIGLFPKTFNDVKTKRSVMNFLAKSANGDTITIDKPEKGSFAFHYKTTPKSTQTTADQPQKPPFSSD